MNRLPQSALERLYQLAGGPWQFLERLRAGTRVDRLAELPLERLLVVREEGILSPLLYTLDPRGALGESVTQVETVPITVATEAAVEQLPSWPELAPDHTPPRGAAAAIALAPAPNLAQTAAMASGRTPTFTQEEASRRPPATPPTSATGMAISAEQAWHDWAARVEAHPELRAAWQQPLNPQPGARENTAPSTPLATPRSQLPVDAAAVAVAGRTLPTPLASLERSPLASFNVLDHMERTLRRLEVDGAPAQRTGVRDVAPALPGQTHSPEVISAPPPGALAAQPLAPEQMWVPAPAPRAAAAGMPAPPPALPPRQASRGLRRLWELSQHTAPPVDAALKNGFQPAEPQLGMGGQSAQTASPGSFAVNTPTLLDEVQFTDLLARILRREAERYGIQVEELTP